MKLENDVCPVCFNTFKRSDKLLIKVNDKRIYFCTSECKENYILARRKLERLGLLDGKRDFKGNRKRNR